MSAREELDAFQPIRLFDTHEQATKNRLAIAGRLAAGMLANPQTYKMQGYQSEVARASWEIAGRLIRQAETSGDWA